MQPNDDIGARRRRALWTAAVLAVVALGFYVGIILSRL